MRIKMEIFILLIPTLGIFHQSDGANFVSQDQRMKTMDNLISNYKYLGDLLNMFESDQQITKHKENFNNLRENCSREVEEYESRINKYKNKLQHQEKILKQVKEELRQEYNERYLQIKEEYDAKLQHEMDMKIDFQNKLNEEYRKEMNNYTEKNEALLKGEVQKTLVLREEYLKCKTELLCKNKVVVFDFFCF